LLPEHIIAHVHFQINEDSAAVVVYISKDDDLRKLANKVVSLFFPNKDDTYVTSLYEHMMERVKEEKLQSL
jgi:hypothetical protein